MEVKPGYKKTEVGVIPEEWEVIPLSKTAKRISRGASPRPIDSPVWFDARSSVGWVRISDVTRSGRYLLETTQRLSDAGIRSSRPVPLGSLIMSICATVGRPVETRINTCIHDGFVVFDQPTIDQSFLYHTLTDLEPKWSKYGQTGSQMNLNTGLINRCLIPIPSLPEQRAIATALSDVDGLLGGLDRLIAKKRDLKQAAMQQLLTGQTRLPGFHAEWEVKRLGEICRITTGKKDVNEGNPNGQFPFFTCSRSHTYSDSYSFDTEAILIAGNGEVGNLHYFKGKFEAYQRTYILSEFTAHIRYLWQQLNARLADALGLGKIGSSIPYIKKENLVDFEFNSPLDTAEQTAIAEVLTEMDGELAVLEQRREKTRALKQAMMQELLTGRIRLL